MTVGATLEIAGPGGVRTVPIEDFFVADGIHNTRLEPGEILTTVRVPIPPAGTRTAYAKLRQRKSIDFPLLTVAVAGEFEDGGSLRELRGVVTALGSRPRTLARWGDEAVGRRLDDEAIDALAERAFQQCHPLENLIADPEWRRAMVPVYVRKALEAIRA
jgi:CO/xanthine dehydrogenase FAD-binding subunit